MLSLCPKDSVFLSGVRLGAVDVHVRRQTTGASFQVFRGRARAAQAKQASQGPEGLDGKGSRVVMVTMPEYIFTYVIALLAHHPNFPTDHTSTTKPEAYHPFQEMLDFVLQVIAPPEAAACLWMPPVGCALRVTLS